VTSSSFSRNTDIDNCHKLLRTNEFIGDFSVISMNPSFFIARSNMAQYSGMYQWTQAFFADYMLPSYFMIDVGANIGITSIPVGILGHKVYAFEPVPKSYRRTMTGICWNGLSNLVHIEHAAVGENDGNITMYESVGADDNSALSANAATKNVGGEVKSYSVKMISLDTWLSHNPEIKQEECALLKIDVQGFELGVLKGARNFLKNNLGTLTVIAEQDPGLMKAAGGSPSQVIDYMVSLGYGVFKDKQPISKEHYEAVSMESTDLTFRAPI
jgi:FkbM family methyltransferase